MNNKGFAITGILYTIFVLFMLIIVAALANMSFKNGTLSKLIAKLEDDYNLTKLESLESGYTSIGEDYYAAYSGKYLFELTYKIDEITDTITCSTYLKKGDIIPMTNNPDLGETNPAKDFILIPSDCNKYYYDTILSGVGGEQKLLLKEIYIFEDSD